MRKIKILGMAAAIMGLLADQYGRRVHSLLFASFSSGMKPSTWHDPARKSAADLRQAKRRERRERNLLHAALGAYGKTHWMAA